MIAELVEAVDLSVLLKIDECMRARWSFLR